MPCPGDFLGQSGMALFSAGGGGEVLFENRVVSDYFQSVAGADLGGP